MSDSERQIPNGRHHRVGEATEWIPVVGATLDRPASHAKPTTSPIGLDRMADTGPPGLHTFNIGSIPASVTPPKTWRRAAWFTIFASASALVGLLTAMSVIVGPVHLARIEGLPSLPTAVPFTDPTDPETMGDPEQLAKTTSPNRTRDETSAHADPNGLAEAAGQPVDPVAGSPVGSSGDPAGTGSSTDPAPTGRSGGPTSAPGPTTVTVTSGPPVVNPVTLGDRTQQYFHEVTTDVNAAANMTDDTLRDDAAAVIQQKYGDVSLIQVKNVSVDPAKGVTVSMLHVVNKDGTSSDEQCTLRFTLSSDPKIENPAG